jgi:hypothetical protein
MNTSFDAAGKPINVISIQPSSVIKQGNRAWGKTKWVEVSSGGLAGLFSPGSKTYGVTGYVFDCNTFNTSVYQVSKYDIQTSELITDDVIGIPNTLKLESDYSSKHTVGYSIGVLMCNPELLTTISGSIPMESSLWSLFSSVDSNTQYSYLQDSVKKSANGYTVIGRFTHKQLVPLNETIVGNSFPVFSGMPRVKTQLFEKIIDCSKKSFALVRSNGLDGDNKLIASNGFLLDTKNLVYTPILKNGFLDKFHNHLCGESK